MKLQDIAQTAVQVSSSGRWYVDEAFTPLDEAVAEWWSLARKRQMVLLQALDQVLEEGPGSRVQGRGPEFGGQKAEVRSQRSVGVEPSASYVQPSAFNDRSALRASRSALTTTDNGQRTTDNPSGPRPSTLDPGPSPKAACVAEAFVTDMLLRVCLAVASAGEQQRGKQTNQLLIRGILLGQLQVRQRLLRLLADDRMWSKDELVLLDRIRRRCERWTDVLLGHLACRHRVDEFAFDPRRARDFGWTQLSLSDRPPLSAVWDLIAAGTRLSFPESLELPEASAAWHRRFAVSLELMLGSPTSCGRS